MRPPSSGSGPQSPAHGLVSMDSTHLYLLLADGVVPPGVVVRCILLTRDQLLRVEQLPVGSCPDLHKRMLSSIVLLQIHLIHHSRLKVDKDSPGHVLP